MNTKLINNLKKSVVKVSSCLMAACIAVTIVGAEVNVSAAEAETTTTVTTTTATTTVKKVSLSKPKLISATRYENGDTHPFNKQTNTLVVRWNAVNNAKQHRLDFIVINKIGKDRHDHIQRKNNGEEIYRGFFLMDQLGDIFRSAHTGAHLMHIIAAEAGNHTAHSGTQKGTDRGRINKGA